MAKSTVVQFELPSEFSPDPLTEVIQAGAKELLRAEHASAEEEEPRQGHAASARHDGKGC